MAGVMPNNYMMYPGQQAMGNQPTPQQQPVQRQPTPTGQAPQQMSQPQPGMTYSQPQGQGQDPQPAALSHHAMRQSQGLPQQNLNPVNTDAPTGNVMDSNDAHTNDGDRNAVLMAALAARAAGASGEAKGGQFRNINLDQIQQLLRANSSFNPNLPMGNVSSAQNVSNWMGQFPNAGAARGAGQPQMGVGQNQAALSQALAFEKRKHVQEAQRQQLQSNAQSSLPGQHAKAGVTGPQMTAIVEKEKAKNPGGSHEERQAAFAEAWRTANRVRGSQAMHNNAQIQMRNGGAGVGVNATAAAAAATAGVQQPSATSGMQRPPVAGTGANNQSGPVNIRANDEAQFWAKLEDMKAKYKHSLQRLTPFIRRLQERQPQPNKEQFKKHLNDCFNILNLERSRGIPPKLTIEVLERAEKFIHSVITVYSQYLKDFAKSANPDPTRRGLQAPNQHDDTHNAVLGPQKGAASQNPSSQQGPQPSSRGTGPQNKPGHSISQSGQGHFDPHQQLIMQHAQLPMQQQKQPVDMLNRAQYQVQQRQQPQLKQQNDQQQPHQRPLQVPQVSSPQQGGQQHGSAALSHNSQLSRPGQGQGPPGTPGDSSKPVASGQGGKGAGARNRGGHQRGRAAPSLPGSRPNLPGSGAPNLPQSQVRSQTGVDPQMQAQMQAHVAAGTHTHAAQTQAARAQAAQSQVQAQAHAQAHALTQSQAEVQNQRFQQGRAQQAVSRGQRNQVRGMVSQQRLPPQGNLPGNGKPMTVSGVASGWGAGQNGMPSNMGGTGVHAPRAKRPELTLQQRVQVTESAVREALTHTHGVEQYLEIDMKRAKNERIQNTLAAVRNNGSMKASMASKGTKRQASLVDVDNFGRKDGVIKSKTVFECSSEDGLRLAKRPKNEAQDLKSLREAVEADCRAAQERNPLLIIEIIEEFGQPVVTCLLKIMEIRLPKLVLRVQRGYPRKGGANYGFERPPMGWVGVLDEIRTRFKRALATAPAASVGVAAFLDAWAHEADAVINGSHLSENR